MQKVNNMKIKNGSAKSVRALQYPLESLILINKVIKS